MVGAVGYLLAEDRGCEWAALVVDWVQVERDMGFEVPGSHVSCKTVMLIAESVNFECCRPPMVVWYFGTDLL